MSNKISSTKDYWVLNIVRMSEELKDEEGIEGDFKMEKLSAITREEIKDEISNDWILIREPYGPRDPGLTRMLQSYKDLDIIELKRIKENTLAYTITEKGKRVLSSFEKFYNKVEDDFQENKNRFDRVLKENINKSGYKLVQTDVIQKMKEAIWGKKL